MPIVSMNDIRLPAVQSAKGDFCCDLGKDGKTHIVVAEGRFLFAVGVTVSVEQVCGFQKQQVATTRRDGKNRDRLSQNIRSQTCLLAADKRTKPSVERQQCTHLPSQAFQSFRQRACRIGQSAGFDEWKHFSRNGKNPHVASPETVSICNDEAPGTAGNRLALSFLLVTLMCRVDFYVRLLASPRGSFLFIDERDVLSAQALSVTRAFVASVVVGDGKGFLGHATPRLV
ncbi:hypothetical protein AGR6A_pAt60173 [Agrobacterium sp. NCPPB 925]|nr:hypothetical protein AGR6A_pAt60173 [Agrobacterium sp. NCPPB 925]